MRVSVKCFAASGKKVENRCKNTFWTWPNKATVYQLCPGCQCYSQTQEKKTKNDKILVEGKALALAGTM